jgi:hypothetical protein
MHAWSRVAPEVSVAWDGLVSTVSNPEGRSIGWADA